MNLPPIVFGTSCLGNLYEVVPDETKRAIVAEMFRHTPAPVTLDSAGKYGAGLALEVIGRNLRQLSARADDVMISNKLGWYRRCPGQNALPGVNNPVWEWSYSQ